MTVQVKADNDKAQVIVSQMVDLIHMSGGYVGESVVVNIVGGEVGLTCRGRVAKGDPVIILPKSCMPILTDFNFRVLDGKMIAEARASSHVSHAHLEAMRLSVELYNLYNKVELYSQYSPPVALRHFPKLCSLLLKSVKAEHLFEKNFDSEENLKIAYFWGNRAYFDADTSTDRLITFLEFADHHSFADAFRPVYKERQEHHLQLQFMPLNGTKSIYVSYSLMDALESFVKYGFVDKTAFFVKSQPCTIELPEFGEILINNLEVNSNQQPPQDWSPNDRNAAFYASQMTVHGDEKPIVEFPFFLIPPERHIKASDEVIRYHLSKLEVLVGASIGSINKKANVIAWKKQIVNHNLKFYVQLAKLAKNAELDSTLSVTSMLKEMLRHQVEIIKRYEKKAL